MKKMLELILLFHNYIDQKRYFIDNMQSNAQDNHNEHQNVQGMLLKKREIVFQDEKERRSWNLSVISQDKEEINKLPNTSCMG